MLENNYAYVIYIHTHTLTHILHTSYYIYNIYMLLCNESLKAYIPRGQISDGYPCVAEL